MSNETDDRSVAMNLFGGISLLQRTGGHQVEVAELQKPLEGRFRFDVVRIFCQGCGSLLGLKEAGAEEVAREGGIEVPVSWSGVYFEVEGCPFCGDGRYAGVRLKPIPQDQPIAKG